MKNSLYGLLIIVSLSVCFSVGSTLKADVHVPLAIAITATKEEATDGLVDQGLRATALVCIGGFFIAMGYDQIRLDSLDRYFLRDLGMLCGGGLLFSRGAKLLKRVWNRLEAMTQKT